MGCQEAGLHENWLPEVCRRELLVTLLYELDNFFLRHILTGPGSECEQSANALEGKFRALRPLIIANPHHRH